MGQDTRFRRPLSRWMWSALGGLAIPLWATWPALALQTHEIPALESLTIIFLVAWVGVHPVGASGGSSRIRSRYLAVVDPGRRVWNG